MFEIIFLIAVSLYFIQSVLFIIGAGKKFKKITDNELPTATVIVAARNEENNILRCLKSLNELIYPEAKLEIILVNDKSTDSTREIICEYIKDKPRFKIIDTRENKGNLRGKTNALANAIDIADGEIILTTDADCIVAPTWAKNIALYYQKDVAMVCGYTTQEAYNNFTGMQMLDFIYLLTVAAGSMNFNMPLSCIGNNMSYRKSVYKEVGGYEGIKFSVTEDFNLLKAIFKLKKYRIIYPLDEGALVESKPCEDIKTLYWQKKRWGVGGLDSDLFGFFVMASGFISHIMMILLPFFFSITAVYLATFKIITDFFFLYPVLKRFNLSGKMKYFLAFEIYFIWYVILLPVVVVASKKVVWKGRKY